MRSFALAAALLLPTMVFAQTAVAPTEAPVAQPAKPKHVPVAASHPAPSRVARQASPEVQDVNQILGIRQIDPATYEIDARLQNGGQIHLRMNAFVMQNLGMQLGTYGKQPGG